MKVDFAPVSHSVSSVPWSSHQVSEFSGPPVARGFGFAGVDTVSQPRKHWRCESKPVCWIDVFGFT